VHSVRAWRASLLVLVLMTQGLLGVTAAHAAGGSGGCNIVKDPTCIVRVKGGGGSGGGGGGTGDPCAPYPGATYGDTPPKVSQACADELQANFCRATLDDILGGLKYPSVVRLTPQQAATVNHFLASAGCPPIVTTATLAQEAFATIVFPHPSGHRSPAESQQYQGYPFSYVGLWTFYWTDPATWRPLKATASAAGLTATVTATPTSLTFHPGDGSANQSCAGPGRAWVESDASSPPTAGACGYQYSQVTGPGYGNPITSTQTIAWAITWTGTGDTGGQIPGLSTSTSGQLNVLQIRTVNR
jgi:hypothetical protein